MCSPNTTIMVFDTNEELQFISYKEAHTIPDRELIVTDSFYPRGLNLSHLYNHYVPQPYRANTSTASVIKWLESLEYVTEREGKRFVTCNHFDIDGLLSVWAALHPVIALRHKEEIIAAATLGDFRECNTLSEAGLKALKLCALINHAERTNFCLPFGDLDDATIEYEVAARKFNYFLPRFAQWIEKINDYQLMWHDEYHQVLADIAHIDEGSVDIQEFPELSLSIVTSKRPLHYYASASRTRGGAVLSHLPEHGYIELEYKYETLVGRLDRETTERIDLNVLASELTLLEADKSVVWKFDNGFEGGPMLRPERIGAPITHEMRYQNIGVRLSSGLLPKTTIPAESVTEKIMEALSVKEKV